MSKEQDEEQPLPLLRPNELWEATGLIKRLKMNRKTFQRWKQNGLPVLKPGTKAEYCWSDDVIEFMRSHPTSDDLEPYEANYKRKRNASNGE